MSKNLMEGLLSEMNRVREIITEYESIPNGAGMFAAAIMKAEIKIAETSIAENNVIEMLYAYNRLQETQL